MSPTNSKRKRAASPAGGAAATARAKLRAEQAAAERRRRQRIFVIVPIAVVLVVVGAFVIIRFADRPTDAPSTAVDPAVITKVTSVPSAVLDQVGPGTIATPPKRIDAPALQQDGKPKMLYVGAEYCPFCAAERWPVVVALSRFGTFSGLGYSTSSARDVYPSTSSLSFHGASYSSDHLVFTGVETRSSEIVNGQYAPLDTLSTQDQQTFDTFNAPPYVEGQGSIPFVDIGGRYLISGSSYDPQLLQGKTHAEIAAALSDPNSEIGKAVDGSANVITAAICATTDNQPSAVCSSAGVTAAQARLS